MGSLDSLHAFLACWWAQDAASNLTACRLKTVLSGSLVWGPVCSGQDVCPECWYPARCPNCIHCLAWPAYNRIYHIWWICLKYLLWLVTAKHAHKPCQPGKSNITASIVRSAIAKYLRQVNGNQFLPICQIKRKSDWLLKHTLKKNEI